MKSFGLSCDKETHRLIQSIPPGIRSKTIRHLILSHAHEIEVMKDEYWALQLEKKVEEERLKKERALHEERMRKEYEANKKRSLELHRKNMLVQQEIQDRQRKRMQERAEWEANRWQSAQESAEPLIEIN
jgi:uncharacterized protein YdaU (DUF1376 family)